jgi:hypothetical protein
MFIYQGRKGNKYKSQQCGVITDSEVMEMEALVEEY